MEFNVCFSGKLPEMSKEEADEFLRTLLSNVFDTINKIDTNITEVNGDGTIVDYIGHPVQWLIVNNDGWIQDWREDPNIQEWRREILDGSKENTG